MSIEKQFIELAGGLKALIDPEEYERLSKFKWHVGGNKKCNTVYACSRNGKTRIKMHRLIMDAKKGEIVDHINGCGIDNRRANLRLCTHSQNMGNMQRMACGSSQFKGVSWDKVKKRWFAKITVNYKQIALGRYKNEMDAARAYDLAAKKHFGSFAMVNL